MSRLLPQLVMVRRGLDSLPEKDLPSGYTIRHFRPGDEAAWERIVAKAFGREDNPDRFDKRIREVEGFRPERVLFVIAPDGCPVATASAMPQNIDGQTVPGLHMVAVLPSEQGKRLGYWINLAVLQQLAREGVDAAFLVTDDDRLAAIKTYRRLGFEPYIVHENQHERWRRIVEKE